MSSKADTILVVDDDSILLATIRRTLELAGYCVLTAQNDVSAKGICREQHIQAMLLDINLGNVSGFDILEWLRSQYPALPVVMITADPKIERVVRAIKMGAFDFLDKPIDRERLLVTVRNALDRTRL